MKYFYLFYLIDMFGSCPCEAAGVIAAKDVKWTVIRE
jgi:hypothetical protein